VMDLAEKVRKVAQGEGLNVRIAHLDNPRVEMEMHYYSARNTKLKELGLEPHLLTDEVLRDILLTAGRHKDRILTENVLPQVTWK
jgi:UDP-sulfoquinovose synthase